MPKLHAKSSALTLLSVSFLKVHVEADFESKSSGQDFDYHKAMVAFHIHHSKTEGGTWNVALAFLTTNENAKNVCPYEIEVQVLGEFSVSQKLDPSRHDKLVYENGSALLYGAIREMISSITSRSAQGPLMIPTASFMGAYEEHIKSIDKGATEEKKSTSPLKKSGKRLKKI